MRFKVDENLPRSAADHLRAAGHDVETAVHEGLAGAEDPVLLSVCLGERRAFITLDKGFGNIRTYRPADYSGIILLKARDQRIPSLLTFLNRLLPVLDAEPLPGNLWIVEETRIRIRR